MAEAPTRYYTPDKLGGLCPVCRTPLPAGLAGDMTEHPTCDPDFQSLSLALTRALARRKARQT